MNCEDVLSPPFESEIQLPFLRSYRSHVTLPDKRNVARAPTERLWRLDFDGKLKNWQVPGLTTPKLRQPAIMRKYCPVHPGLANPS